MLTSEKLLQECCQQLNLSPLPAFSNPGPWGRAWMLSCIVSFWAATLDTHKQPTAAQGQLRAAVCSCSIRRTQRTELSVASGDTACSLRSGSGGSQRTLTAALCSSVMGFPNPDP